MGPLDSKFRPCGCDQQQCLLRREPRKVKAGEEGTAENADRRKEEISVRNLDLPTCLQLKFDIRCRCLDGSIHFRVVQTPCSFWWSDTASLRRLALLRRWLRGGWLLLHWLGRHGLRSELRLRRWLNWGIGSGNANSFRRNRGLGAGRHWFSLWNIPGFYEDAHQWLRCVRGDTDPLHNWRCYGLGMNLLRQVGLRNRSRSRGNDSKIKLTPRASGPSYTRCQSQLHPTGRT
jgi:hypothetical protein